MTQQIVSKAVGIDLGTTNSAVAIMNPADSEIVIHRDPNTKSVTTPSCVWRSPKGGELVVGRKALAWRGRGTTAEPVLSVKRKMGTTATVELGGEKLTPAQVSAAILREMKQQIETDVAAFATSTSRWVVDRAVVTVPAYFDQPQIDATREAAEQAGLEVLGLLHEPTAAASHYCWRTATQDGTFLVYDLGGGTFDVSLLRCTAGTFEVLGISGNNMLGGDDIDKALARRLQEMLQSDGYALDLDPENDPEDRLRFTQLQMLAENAKKALSERTEFMVRESGQLLDQQGEPVIIEAVLERADLEAAARPLIERTFTYCDEAIGRAAERAGITLADVDHVILAGGSTHMPLVRELVTRELCTAAAPDSPRQVRAACAEPVYEQVDTVVALGAAVRAAAVGGLDVYDERRTVRVSFHGSAATGESATSVGGTVTPLVEGLDLTDGQVVLSTSVHEEQDTLSQTGAFAFDDVPLRPDAETQLTVEVYDANGDLRAVAARPLAHSSGEERPTGGMGGAAINAKDVTMEVDRGDGRVEPLPLVRAMQPLPFERDFHLKHPGKERVELRLFQERVPIQVITVEVPSSTPLGAAIQLNVAMHENAAITVRGTIGEVSFDAPVELPGEQPMPDPTEVDQLRRHFEENVSYLPAGPQAVKRAKWTMVYKAFEEARDSGDVAKAVHEFHELQQLADSVTRHTPGLEPPKQEFDDLVEACLGLHTHLARHGVPEGRVFDAPETSRTIEEQRQRGERAWSAGDQRAYGEVIEHLQRMYEYLRELTRIEDRPDVPPAIQAEALVQAGLSGVRQLTRVAAGTGQAAEQRELEEIRSRLERLEPLTSAQPERVLQEAGKVMARLRQLARLLLGDGGPEKAGIPILEGGPR